MCKKLTWLHISDIHFHSKTEWRDNIARDSLINYLYNEFNRDNSLRPDLIFCTGDIAYGETESSPLETQYGQAMLFFDKLLDVCGRNGSPLSKKRLFIVPGNHDINRENINLDAQFTLRHWAESSNKYVNTISQRFNDRTKEFTDIIKRLNEYAKFVSDYVPHHLDQEGRHCYTHIVDIDGLNIGIAGFNSAWTCAGPEDDRMLWLAAEWQFNTAKKHLDRSDVRIGLIHHPTDWLNANDREIATRRISTDFHFWLHGHSHNTWVTPESNHITIAAGAVGAQASEEFGINLVHLDLPSGNGKVYLHQHKASGTSWTIAPVEMHAPQGCWPFELPSNLCQSYNSLQSNNSTNNQTSQSDKEGFPSNNTRSVNTSRDLMDRHLSSKLNEALLSFSSQPEIWVDPIINKNPELASDAESWQNISPLDLLANPKPTIIKAPPQFGLTCLAHHLIREAWRIHNSFWLYIDFNTIKPHSGPIKQAAEAELEFINGNLQDIKCVILDSWTNNEKHSHKIIPKIYAALKDIPIIIMQTINESNFTNISLHNDIDDKFQEFYLWSLPRGQVRKVVSKYNDTKHIGDEDALTTRIISDLEMLNIHRTPLNCITLLKVAEADFDESPINRTEMIMKVLFLIFNTDDIPTYKARPDLKDCAYVLGYFSEVLLREYKYYFSMNYFLTVIGEFCKSRLIELDVQVVFDILYSNNMVVRRDNQFCFKFSYWIHYFAAQRMHHNKNFADFIFENVRYANCPEIIEFYTGIDRHREDALHVLIKDLRAASDKIKTKSGLPDGLNPYKYAQWHPSTAMQEQMQKEICNGVLGSNLPEAVKDRYADRCYNPARPYQQEIQEILSEYSFVYMMQIMKAGAKALRNSDYAAPEIRRELLIEILNCWEQVSKVLLVLLPILSEHGYAKFEGGTFFLDKHFSNTPKERFYQILSAIPTNVVSWCQDDLFSMKMGPLLIDQLTKEKNELKKHELMLLLIQHRPRGWKTHVTNYIITTSKNSFYLFDIYTCLRAQYRYSYASSNTLSDIEHLIKMTAAKHVTGCKNPRAKQIEKVSDKVIPSRQVDPSI